jgi:hypothetical protein
MVDFKGVKNVLESNLSCFKVHYEELEAQFDTLENTTLSTSSTNLYSSSSTSKGCKRCIDHDMNACATNLTR